MKDNLQEKKFASVTDLALYEQMKSLENDTDKPFTVEILFPDLCNLFGDLANMRYLNLCLPNSNFIKTAFGTKPLFLSEDVDLVYMGPCSENTQEHIIDFLMPYKNEIKEKIENGTNFFFTGNALEILGNYIESENGDKKEALGIFDLYAKQNLTKRHNSECEAILDDIKVLGFKSQFSTCYNQNVDNFLFKMNKGMGMNPSTDKEGIHYKNFVGTYLIAPILISNPDFTKFLLKKIGVANPKLAFEEQCVTAYQKNLADFNKNIN